MAKLIKSDTSITNIDNIQGRIFTIRGVQVMIDRDLAEIYGVENKRLNEQVRRNRARFPEAFRFQLTDDEKEQLVATCDRLNSLKHSSSNPYAFTEQGVSMLSTVLHSETAIKVSIIVINAFVEMRRFLSQNAYMIARLDSVERRQLAFETETEKNFEKVLRAMDSGETPKEGIFYNGQFFDAYVFISNLIRKAKRSLILIDNYIDDSVLNLVGKRADGVSANIYTQTISKQLALDLIKHNQQYPASKMNTTHYVHDRFLIIDENEIYHIGASLKDLGKKCFAFAKLDIGAVDMLTKLGLSV